MNKLKILFFIILMAITTSAQNFSNELQKTADLFVSAYNDKQYEKFSSQIDEAMQKAIPFETLKTFLDETHKNFGKIVKLDSPDFANPMTATFPVQFERGKLDMILVSDAAGKVSGLRFTPPKPKSFARNEIKLDLPFKGEWLIIWGGDSVTQNYHQDHPNQRFAFDIVKVGENGKTHKSDGSKNEDYYAFGQEIISPADGVVTDVISGVRNNVPGVLNPLTALGNAVMIRHNTGEVSVFAHLKFDSIRVKAGDKVKAGQTIGLCGNSGNSSEAHLHYQLQKTNLFEDEGSIKVFFEDVKVRRGGKPELKKDYSPIKGDIVNAN